MADAALAYRDAFLQGLVPEPAGLVSEWADANRILTSEASSEPGPWRTDRVPHAREPMDCMSASSPIRRVVLIWGSQTGKTEVILNSIGYAIEKKPGPMLVVQPTLDMVKRFNRQRLDPMLRTTPVLNQLVAANKARDSANTIFMKSFQGGVLMMVGANSGSGLQSSPILYLFGDEISSWTLDADGKGDPLENAEARTTNFPRRKILATSTPGEEGACRITKEFQDRSDKREREVPCPACGSFQVLVWDHFKWDRPDGEVLYECAHCGERFEERYKREMLPAGRWVARARGDGVTAGFHLPGWYSPLGWLGWAQIRDEFLRSKHDRELLKGWVNKRKAEAFSEAIRNTFNEEGLKGRRNDTEAGNGYPNGTVPVGVLLLTAAVDVQGGGGSIGERLVVSVIGWGEGEECWPVFHGEIHGNPQGDEVWKQLDKVGDATWTRADGVDLTITLGGIDDGGHAPHKVREFCERRERWVPMKGSGAPGKPIVGRGQAVAIDRKNRAVSTASRRTTLLYTIGTYASTKHLQGRLRIEAPGPGYIHLGQCCTDQYLAELFPWRQVPELRKGFTVYHWELPPGQHDEAGDCMRMAYVAMLLVMRRYGSKGETTMWGQLAEQFVAQLAGVPVNASAPIKRKKGGWLQ